MPEEAEETSGIFHDRQMDGLEPLEQAKRAIAYTLRRIQSDPNVGWYLGIGTQTFGLLTEAYATCYGQPLEQVRRAFNCPNARNPRGEEEGE